MVKIFAVCILVACSSCSLIMGENEPLSRKRKDNTSDDLRLNGYYVRSDTVVKNVQQSVYFLYKDGKLLYFGTFDQTSFDIKYLSNHTIVEKVRSAMPSWGVYQIDNNAISFEKWHYTGGAPKVTYVRRGSILNDTTFMITKVSRPDGSEQTDVSETYRFKKFHPKPDSTNEFIK